MKKPYLTGAITLFALWMLSIDVAQPQEPTNPAAAVLKSHIMVTPEEIKWEECPPALPRGAMEAVGGTPPDAEPVGGSHETS